MTILFGMGSGRCGTNSLAELLNQQPGVCCFHEMAPSVMAWENAEETVGSVVRDFRSAYNGGERHVSVDRVSNRHEHCLTRLRSLQWVNAMGDVASYYLPYVEFILEREPQARFPVMRRARDATVKSFVRKMSDDLGKQPMWPLNRKRARNHWATIDDRWIRDPVWDKNFPSFSLPRSSGLSQYVGLYYDTYYKRVDALVAAFPENVRVFGLELLATSEGRSQVLQFCLPGMAHVDIEVHLNKTSV